LSRELPAKAAFCKPSELRTPLDNSVVYTSSITTSLNQPMDLGVRANFKAYYLQQICMEMEIVSGRSDEIIKDNLSSSLLSKN
jgi:hypothetical protein